MIKLLVSFFLYSIFFMGLAVSETIKKVDINGNKRIADETILVLGDIEVGKDYKTNDLNTIIKKLYDTEFFEDISIIFENDTLVINLIENPIIEDIEITGIKSNQTKEKILDALTLKNRKSFIEESLQKDLILIRNILKTNGFYFVKVVPSISKNEKLNSIRLVIDINEGPKARIKKYIIYWR